MVSFLPGGLGMAGILACAMFGAISGSTVATVVAIGGFMIPALREHGYPDSYTTGLMASAPNLGVIIPPSIGMILYSMITNVSLEGLFLSGFVPGFLIVVLFCAYTVFYFRNDKNITRNPPPDLKSVIKAFKNGFFAIMLPVLIFGGIFSGVFTANEAAVVACVYAFIVEIFIHRTMKLRDVYNVTINSAVTSATLLMIVAGATCFGRFITLENIPGRLTDFVMGSIDSSISFLLVMNIFLLVVGMFMDIISAVLIIGPVIVPMLYSFNIDPLHFGLIMTVNLAIGYCTPPMGVSLFITDTIAKRGIIKISKSVFPFLLIQIFVLLLITYLPDLVLYLPKVFGFIK
jgi:C4-dicarboxylate transporter DctM subunit